MKNRKDFWFWWLIVWGIVIAFLFGINAIAYFACENPECNHLFFGFKIVSQIFILTTVIAYVICHFIDYARMNKADDESVRMKFDHFKDVYCVNPSRWGITPDYWSENFGRLRYRNGKDYWHEECYYVTFTYFDWLKFLFWNKFRKYEEKLKRKIEKKQEANERLAEMLRYVQNDINEAYEKINKE